MATRPRIASRSGRDGGAQQQPGDDSNLIQPLDQAMPGEARRKKRRRAARELARALPDALDSVLDLVQHLWP